jgi:hypothetical protein
MLSTAFFVWHFQVKCPRRDTDPVANGSSNQLDQESGGDLLGQHQQRKRRNVIPQWMKQAVY